MATIKSNEVVVKKNDFGLLVEEFIRNCLLPRNSIDVEWVDTNLRRWWPQLEEYYQRHILCSIEVTLALDEPPRYNREPMDPFKKFVWARFVKDLRPPKHPYTVKYQCNKCKTEGVKLWRGVHGCQDKEGNELLCATCLAPNDKVDDEGRWQGPPYKYKDVSGNPCEAEGLRTDQVNGWLPAIPVDDTYWGYSSVPSQDVEWWQALPTYPKK